MSKIGLFAMMANLMAQGISSKTAYQEATRVVSTQGTAAIYIPKKHTKMSYAKQNRLAKARKNKSMYAKR